MDYITYHADSYRWLMRYYRVSECEMHRMKVISLQIHPNQTMARGHKNIAPWTSRRPIWWWWGNGLSFS